MARSFAEDTVETSTTTGTGDYTLAGPKGDYFPFEASFVTGDKPVYAVRNDGNTKVEFNRGGVYTEGDPATLTRGVWKSTNGNAPVSWTVDDHPLTIYIPASAELHEGVVTGWAATARHALLRAGAIWSKLTTDWTSRVPLNLYDGTAEREIGVYEGVVGIFAASPRQYWIDKGAANYVMTAADIGRVFEFDCTAAARTYTALAGATTGIGHGFTVFVLGYGSNTNGVVFAPNGSEVVDNGAAGASLTIQPNVLTRLSWDGAKNKWRTSTERRFRTIATSKGALYGLKLSTAGSSATFAVSAGHAADSTGAALMELAAFTKTTGAWAVGSGNGAMDAPTVANDTWYHVFIIQRVDTGVVDVLFSLSATAPTMPTGYTLFRRIGSMKTNGSAQWTKFTQNGDRFYILPVVAFSQTAGQAATLNDMKVPTGVILQPICSIVGQVINNNTGIIQFAPATDATLLFTAQLIYEGSGVAGSSSTTVLDGPPTNTAAQIYIANPSISGGSMVVSTIGWIDLRGQDG